MKFFNICLSLFILLSIFTICRTEDADCVYTIYVMTGTVLFAGTDSKISLTLYDAKGYGFNIDDLEAWGGLMGLGHNYFESGNVDIFSGKGGCLKGPICALNLTSDGSGRLSSWFCDYIAVTTTGIQRPCAQKKFKVHQFLSKILFPFQLSASRNNCKKRMIDGHDPSNISDFKERISDGYDLSKNVSDI